MCFVERKETNFQVLAPPFSTRVLNNVHLAEKAPRFTKRKDMFLTVNSNRVQAEISFKARVENLDPKCVENVNPRPGFERGAPFSTGIWFPLGGRW